MDRKKPDSIAAFPLGRSSSEVVEIVRLNRQIPRSEVIEHTLLSQQTVHRVTTELVDRQLLALHEPVVDGRGKPSPRLTLAGSGAFATGIAINTSSVEVAHIDFAGNVLSSIVLDADPNNPAAVIDQALKADIEQSGLLGLNPARCGGVGVSMQGYRNSKSGSFTTPLPLQAWSHFSAVEKFSEKFGPHVYIENNATLGAIAESWIGAGDNYKSFAYLSFNHGFGGGIILDGQPIFGAFGNAGEMSALYTPNEMDNRPAMSGLLADLQNDGIDVQSVSDLLPKFDPTWPAVQQWVDRVSPALNQLIRGLNGILDPDAIVFGGEAPNALKNMLIDACDERGPDRHGRPVPGSAYVISDLPNDPSLIGAGINAMRYRVLGM